MKYFADVNKLTKSIESRNFIRIVTKDFVHLSPGIVSQVVRGVIIAGLIGFFLKPSEYAKFQYIYVGSNYVLLFFYSWIQVSAIRFLPNKEELSRDFLRFALAVGLPAAFVITVYEHIIIKTDFGALTVCIICLYVASEGVLRVGYGILRGRFNVRRFTVTSIMESLSRTLLLIAFLSVGLGLVGAFSALLLGGIVGLALQFGKVSLRKPNSEKILSASLQYGFPLSISALLLSMQYTLDRILIGNYFSTEEVGAYAFWMAIGLGGGRALFQFIFMAFNPRIFQLYDNNKKKGMRQLRKIILLYICIFPVILTLCAFLVPPSLAVLSLGAGYLKYQEVFSFSMGVVFFLGLTQLLVKPLEFEKKTFLIIIAALFSLVVLIFALPVSIEYFGLVGAAIAVIFAAATYCGTGWVLTIIQLSKMGDI